VTDESGVRLAKRHDSLSLRELREAGRAPEDLRRPWESAITCGYDVVTELGALDLRRASIMRAKS